jgi:uncharacterized delta-60 repeat protein
VSIGKLIKGLIAVSCAVAMGASVYAAPFTPDPSFGISNGRITVSPFDDAASGEPNALALMPDGAVVVGGTCYSPYRAMCFIRLLPNGQPDPDFGTNGRLLAVNDGPSSTQTLVAQRDGKFLAAGQCAVDENAPTTGCIRRYTATGAPDPNFGTNGLVRFNARSASGADINLFLGRMLMFPDNKIVLSGVCSDFGRIDLCALRLLPNGNPDPNFGNQGTAVIDSFPGAQYASRGTAVLQTDGKIVLVGDCTISNAALPSVACITRLNANGVVDDTFGVSGYRLLSTPLPAENTPVTDIALRPGAGFMLLTSDSGSGDPNLIAFTAQGDIDTSFSPTGKKKIVSATFLATKRLIVQPDGKILVNARCSDTFQGYPCIARFHADGAIDSMFPFTNIDAGQATSSDLYYNAMALQSDGKIVLTGFCRNSSVTPETKSLCAVRLLGGPNDYQHCSADIDGDGLHNATDSLLLTRAALGFRGSAVVQGVNFAFHASRTNWPDIRDYLGNQCGMPVLP